MDDIQKGRMVSAIYVAVSAKNYRCAKTILDDACSSRINEVLEVIINLSEEYEYPQLIEKIKELKKENF
ncbi:MAG: hypothetical protein MI865_06815 [Proteobacteria bacterium]|nr:hypothetical protein [Pseudomonadota bacterium]